MDIAKIMATRFRGVEFSCGETYESLKILDGSKKPSLEDLEALWEGVFSDAAVKRLTGIALDMVEAKAREKGYESALECISYAGDADPWGTEGAELKKWRSDVRSCCSRILAGGTLPKPEQLTDEILAECPAPW